MLVRMTAAGALRAAEVTFELPVQSKYAPKVMSAYKKTSRFHERFNFFKMVPKGRRSATARRWRALLVRSAAEDDCSWCPPGS